jgi:hypothetical protein
MPRPPCFTYEYVASCVNGIAMVRVKQTMQSGHPPYCPDLVHTHTCEMGCTVEGNLSVPAVNGPLGYENHPEVLCKGECPDGDDCPEPSTETWAPTACDAQTIFTYGGPTALGKVGPMSTTSTCLLAWDTTANMQRSAVARVCLGGWECPVGTICDDAIPTLPASFTTKFAVCKPGPRGELTASMLTP